MLQYTQGQVTEDAAVPTGVYGDDFDDAGSTRIGLTTRPASGTEPGVTYGWDYEYVVAGNLSTHEMIWLPDDRSGIQREVFPTGGTPAGVFLAPFDLGIDGHYVEVRRYTSGIANINFGGCIGCAPPLNNDLTGAVHVTAGSPTSDIGLGIEQFVNSNGSRTSLGGTGPSPYGAWIRLEWLPSRSLTQVRCYPNYIGDPDLWEDFTLAVTLGGTYAGLAARRAGDPSTATIYDRLRLGSL